MWYGIRMSSKTNPELAEVAGDLMHATLRTLVFASGGLGLVWYMIANFTDWWVNVPGISVVLVVILVPSVLALRLARDYLLGAQILWLIGVAAGITAGFLLFRRPAIAFLYMLLPLAASVTTFWLAGLITEGVIIGLVWWLSMSWPVLSLLQGDGLVIVIGGAAAAALGWGVTHALLTATEWALFSFQQARQEIEEAREQRVELGQIQEDLVLANQELSLVSDRLRVMKRIADGARRAKEEFVANVSHELRTPLNMIIGFSEMIMQMPQVYGGKMSQALLADITAINRNSQHLSRLVDDVLDLSQIDAGRMALSREWVSLSEIVEEAVQTVGALFESKRLHLKTEAPDDLPTVFCDRTRIRQVVINVLSNSGRFTERGGVLISVKQEQREIVVSITDTGPGIAPEDQERLFEPFQQLDSSIRRRHGGSGLGLSISKRFVEMHGGRIWMESVVGKGTTIFFSLPIEQYSPIMLDRSDDAQRWFNPYDGVEYRLRTRRSKAPVPEVAPRYVIVERGRTLQRLFSRYLPDMDIVAAEAVDTAIAELSRSPAQALVLNIPPCADTPELARQLMDLPFRTPAVTCWVPGEDEAARQMGAEKYLVKPVSRETVLATIDGFGGDVRTVLLVDDDQEVLRLFTRMISSFERGYRILQATDGERALDLMQNRQPDLVLLDLIMPGMDGRQVLEEKSKNPSIRDIPVVVVSSRDPSGDLVMSDRLTVAAGGRFTANSLLACIQAVSGVLALSENGPRIPQDRVVG